MIRNSTTPNYICDWPDCKNSLMTAAGNLYTASDIRKHYKLKHSTRDAFQCPHRDCRTKGNLVFYHRLEDFLAHFELHYSKLAEISESAVQTSATREDQVPPKYSVSRAQTHTLLLHPGQSPKPQISEADSSSLGDSPLASKSASPFSPNAKSPREEPKLRKRQMSLRILPQSAKLVSSLNDDLDTRHTPQDLNKGIAKVQESSQQEPAIDATSQPEPR